VTGAAFTLPATIEVPEGVSLDPALTSESIERIFQQALKASGYWYSTQGGGVRVIVGREPNPPVTEEEDPSAIERVQRLEPLPDEPVRVTPPGD